MKQFTTSARVAKAVPALILGASLFGALAAARAEDGNWANWRGPNGTGSVSTGEYPVKWDGTNVAWSAPLPGKGGSTPIVWKDRIYLTTPDAGEDAVVAFGLDGKALWQTKLGAETPPKHRTLGSSCNSSPVTDGRSLYVLFKSGNFAALGLDGKVLWETNLVQQFGPEHLYWDQGSSPVLTQEEVVISRIHDGESWIAGFNKATGELRWREARNYKCPRENNNGYSTPTLFQEHGKNALLVWGADHLSAHDASNGKLLWSCGGFNPEGTVEWPAIPSPLIVGDLAIVAVGRDDRHQARLHGIRLGGEGDVTATHRVWERDDLGVFVASPVSFQGRIYLVRHRGEVACVNAADGKTLWSDAFPKDKSSYFSSPTIGNGVLYAAREDGVVFAAKVGEKFELLGENPMGERVIAAPVPVANRLLIRGDKHLFCISR